VQFLGASLYVYPNVPQTAVDLRTLRLGHQATFVRDGARAGWQPRARGAVGDLVVVEVSVDDLSAVVSPVVASVASGKLPAERSELRRQFHFAPTINNRQNKTKCKNKIK
jgi:hypothetical protein